MYDQHFSAEYHYHEIHKEDYQYFISSVKPGNIAGVIAYDFGSDQISHSDSIGSSRHVFVGVLLELSRLLIYKAQNDRSRPILRSTLSRGRSRARRRTSSGKRQIGPPMHKRARPVTGRLERKSVELSRLF